MVACHISNKSEEKPHGYIYKNKKVEIKQEIPLFVCSLLLILRRALTVCGGEKNQGKEEEHHHHRDEEQEGRRRRQRWQHQWEPQEHRRRPQQDHQQDAAVHLGPYVSLPSGSSSVCVWLGSLEEEKLLCWRRNMNVALCERQLATASLIPCSSAVYIYWCDGLMVVGGPLSGRPRMPVGTDSWRGHAWGRPATACCFVYQ